MGNPSPLDPFQSSKASRGCKDPHRHQGPLASSLPSLESAPMAKMVLPELLMWGQTTGWKFWVFLEWGTMPPTENPEVSAHICHLPGRKNVPTPLPRSLGK